VGHSPAIHGSAHGVTSIVISAYSHPLPNQPQATVKLAAVQGLKRVFRKEHFLINDESY